LILKFSKEYYDIIVVKHKKKLIKSVFKESLNVYFLCKSSLNLTYLEENMIDLTLKLNNYQKKTKN
jgi:hypothetical protein